MEKLLLLRMTKYDRRWEPVCWCDFLSEIDEEVAKSSAHLQDHKYRVVTVKVYLDTLRLVPGMTEPDAFDFEVAREADPEPALSCMTETEREPA
jgi:hypothetical protein